MRMRLEVVLYDVYRNSGVDMTNDGIRVYDSLGRLCVAVGKLS
jgi:hypothetical protein